MKTALLNATIIKRVSPMLYLLNVFVTLISATFIKSVSQTLILNAFFNSATIMKCVCHNVLNLLNAFLKLSYNYWMRLSRSSTVIEVLWDLLQLLNDRNSALGSDSLSSSLLVLVPHSRTQTHTITQSHTNRTHIYIHIDSWLGGGDET